VCPGRTTETWTPIALATPTAISSLYLHFGWYQGVVGMIANHVYDSRKLQYLDQLRTLTSGDVGWTTIDLVEDIEAGSPGLVEKLDRLGVLWRERPDVR
jgi:hypothetical protein